MSENEIAAMERRLAVLGHVVIGYDRYTQLCRDADEAEAIVRALSAEPSPEAYESGGCLLCSMNGLPPQAHDMECPWRRAREWVDAHPR